MFRSSPKVSHLFFADDLLLFAVVGIDQVCCIKESLGLFCDSSGQKINFTKSLLFVSPNIVEQRAKHLSKEFRVPPDEGSRSLLRPLSYSLGKQSQITRNIAGRMRGKLESWKSKSLLRAGRINHAKTVLNSVPVFFMQLERLPSQDPQGDRQVSTKVCLGELGDREDNPFVKLGYPLPIEGDGRNRVQEGRGFNQALVCQAGLEGSHA